MSGWQRRQINQSKRRQRACLNARLLSETPTNLPTHTPPSSETNRRQLLQLAAVPALATVLTPAAALAAKGTARLIRRLFARRRVLVRVCVALGVSWQSSPRRPN